MEVGLAFGGELPLDEPAEIMRFANRVPLQYQPKACAISESVYDTNWKSYELQQPKGSLPIAPMVIVVHLASVWVPFTSEAKEAVAHYDELLREMKLAIQECGRKLGSHLRARAHAQREPMRRSLLREVHPGGRPGALRDPRAPDRRKTKQPFYKGAPHLRGRLRRNGDRQGAAAELRQRRRWPRPPRRAPSRPRRATRRRLPSPRAAAAKGKRAATNSR